LDCLELGGADLIDYLPDLIRELNELDDLELRLLELKFFEEQSFKQISELLEIGESAAKMRLYRLLGKLKRKLGKVS